MKLIIEESKNLKGSFNIPPAKAHGWRILFLSGFAKGKSIIRNAKESKDWSCGIDGMQKMGAKFNKISEDEWEVEGIGEKYILPDDVLYCGNSGPLLRYYIGICAAIFDNYVVVTGDNSIRHLRPSGPIIDAVNQLGAWAVSSKGDNHAPVIIKGKMNKNKCIVEGSDSQTISGLLIGCALRKTNTEIIVKNAGEKGWVGMTIYWLNKAGIQVENIGNNYDHYIVHGGNQIKSLGQMTVPNDWQAAPSPIIAGILIPGSKIEILDMDPKDVCPDRLVVDALKKMGANILYKKNSVIAQYSPNLKGIRIDPNWYTDQFMPI
ncbi:MAG: hypothetical protein Q7R95_04400, partial [bacterium]|nr:hypothetical protein [bacterium]